MCATPSTALKHVYMGAAWAYVFVRYVLVVRSCFRAVPAVSHLTSEPVLRLTSEPVLRLICDHPPSHRIRAVTDRTSGTSGHIRAVTTFGTGHFSGFRAAKVPLTEDYCGIGAVTLPGCVLGWCPDCCSLTANPANPANPEHPAEAFGCDHSGNSGQELRGGREGREHMGYAPNAGVRFWVRKRAGKGPGVSRSWTGVAQTCLYLLVAEASDCDHMVTYDTCPS